MYMFSNDANTGNRMGYCHWIYSFCPLDLTKLLRFWFKQLRVGGYESRRAAIHGPFNSFPRLRRRCQAEQHYASAHLYDELIPYSSDNMSHSC